MGLLPHRNSGSSEVENSDPRTNSETAHVVSYLQFYSKELFRTNPFENSL